MKPIPTVWMHKQSSKETLTIEFFWLNSPSKVYFITEKNAHLKKKIFFLFLFFPSLPAKAEKTLVF